MGFINCCSGMRISKTFALRPDEGYIYAQADYIAECPICSDVVLQLTRMDVEGNVTVCRNINAKALKLFEKLKSSILYELKSEGCNVAYGSKFYLYYNEYGKKKKCYSSLSALKMGLFESVYELPAQKDLIAV